MRLLALAVGIAIIVSLPAAWCAELAAGIEFGPPTFALERLEVLEVTRSCQVDLAAGETLVSLPVSELGKGREDFLLQRRHCACHRKASRKKEGKRESPAKTASRARLEDRPGGRAHDKKENRKHCRSLPGLRRGALAHRGLHGLQVMRLLEVRMNSCKP